MGNENFQYDSLDLFLDKRYCVPFKFLLFLYLLIDFSCISQPMPLLPLLLYIYCLEHLSKQLLWTASKFSPPNNLSTQLCHYFVFFNNTPVIMTSSLVFLVFSSTFLIFHPTIETLKAFVVQSVLTEVIFNIDTISNMTNLHINSIMVCEKQVYPDDHICPKYFLQKCCRFSLQ